MSWLDRVQSDLSITTGDGRVFTPEWINAVKSKDYNITQFDFPEQVGTLVYRTTPRGSRYVLEIIFQGDDHIDQADAFEVSADDRRAWHIEHPYFGSIVVQPLSLDRDNTKFNVTQFTIPVVETITEDNPKTTIDPKDKIVNDKAVLDDIFAQSFANDVQPGVREINRLSSNNTRAYREGVKGIKLDLDSEEYFNLFNKANSAILNATSEPLAAMREMQAVLSYPSLFQDSAQNRLNTLARQFQLLRESLATITDKSDKKIYENNAGTLVSAMALSASTPQELDYTNRNEVMTSLDVITDAYNQYVTDLDTLQTANGGEPESYIPDSDSLTALNALVNYTISNLFNIAIDAKQERFIIVEEDTNIIILAHRLYGLLPDDSTINQLMEQNQIGISEILGISKGRKIVYYK